MTPLPSIPVNPATKRVITSHCVGAFQISRRGLSSPSTTRKEKDGSIAYPSIVTYFDDFMCGQLSLCDNVKRKLKFESMIKFSTF
jgi:hypothetical protein